MMTLLASVIKVSQVSGAALDSRQSGHRQKEKIVLRTLKDELHIHLYGCLTSKQLFECGRDLWPKREARLDWYATEYMKAWGRDPQWRRYWQDANGLEQVARDFEFREAAPFAKFQACFNLAIALFPVAVANTTVLETVLRDDRDAGLRYVEYRCPVPPTLAASDVAPYIKDQAHATARIDIESGGAFTPRLVFSLSRDPVMFETQYRALKAVMTSDAVTARIVVAIDLCGVEENNPPQRMAPLIATVHRDNKRDPTTALAVLYHVGESFEDMTLASSIRWIHEAQALGAHRLGHALALGIEPESLRTQRHLQGVKERVRERRDHLEWLNAQAGWLGEAGYSVNTTANAQELTALATRSPDELIEIVYDDAWIVDTRRFQDAVMRDLAAKNALIECCPTSNIRIGRIGPAAAHPMPRFMAAGLNVILSSDDPGVFAADLGAEETLARDHWGLDDGAIHALATRGERSRSPLLVDRPSL